MHITYQNSTQNSATELSSRLRGNAMFRNISGEGPPGFSCSSEPHYTKGLSSNFALPLKIQSCSTLLLLGALHCAGDVYCARSRILDELRQVLAVVPLRMLPSSQHDKNTTIEYRAILFLTLYIILLDWSGSSGHDD